MSELYTTEPPLHPATRSYACDLFDLSGSNRNHNARKNHRKTRASLSKR